MKPTLAPRNLPVKYQHLPPVVQRSSRPPDNGSSTQAPVCTQYFVRSLGRIAKIQGTDGHRHFVATILASVTLVWLKHVETSSIQSLASVVLCKNRTFWYFTADWQSECRLVTYRTYPYLISPALSAPRPRARPWSRSARYPFSTHVVVHKRFTSGGSMS